VLAAGCEYLIAAPAALLGGTFLLRGRRSAGRVLAWLAGGAALPAGLLCAYHAACFGAPFTTGYSYVALPMFAEGQQTGLFGIGAPSQHAAVGLLLGPERGLFFIAPICLVAVIGLIVAIRRTADPAPRVGALVVGLLFILNAGYYMWWGGAAVAPRHLIPALGFLGFGVAVAARPGWTRRVTLAVGFLSVLNMLVLTLVGIEAPERGNMLFNYAWPRLVGGEALPSGASNLAMRVGFTRAASIAPIVAWLATGWRYVFSLLGDEEEGDVRSPR
jgi:hypothetical protein